MVKLPRSLVFEQRSPDEVGIKSACGAVLGFGVLGQNPREAIPKPGGAASELRSPAIFADLVKKKKSFFIFFFLHCPPPGWASAFWVNFAEAQPL